MTEMTPDRLAYEMSKIPRERRVRLCLQDFEDRGIDVIAILWETIMDIEEPSVRADKILKTMGYMFPKIDKIQINNVQTEDKMSYDLSKVPSSELIRVLKEG